MSIDSVPKWFVLYIGKSLTKEEFEEITDFDFKVLWRLYQKKIFIRPEDKFIKEKEEPFSFLNYF